MCMWVVSEWEPSLGVACLCKNIWHSCRIMLAWRTVQMRRMVMVGKGSVWQLGSMVFSGRITWYI